jgi:hypothetical protein
MHLKYQVIQLELRNPGQSPKNAKVAPATSETSIAIPSATPPLLQRQEKQMSMHLKYQAMQLGSFLDNLPQIPIWQVPIQRPQLLPYLLATLL